MKRSYSLLLILAMTLAMVMSMSAAAFADEEPAPADGVYGLPEYSCTFSMLGPKYAVAPTKVEVKGEDAIFTLTLNQAHRYSEIYIGKYADITEDNKDTIGIKGVVHGANITFEIPLKTADLGKPQGVVIRYKEKYNEDHDHDWYKASKDHTFSLGKLEKPVVTELALTNNIGMFKPETLSVIDYAGRYELDLGFSSESLKYLFVGAAADATNEEAYKIANADGKGRVVFPVGAVDKPLLLSTAGKGQYYNRVLTIDMAAKTAVFDPYPAGERFFPMTEEELLAYVKKAANQSLLDELIESIQVQSRDENTDKLCKAAALCWDLLKDEAGIEDDGYFSDDTGDASEDDPLNEVPDKRKELLVVSFGTSFNESRVATISAVEKALQKAYPAFAVRRAFTAQIIINHIAARDGEQIDNVKQAMDKAVEAGVKFMVVQPTHLMSGYEYDELKKEIDGYADKIKILYAKPLLDTDEDKTLVAKAIVKETAAQAGYQSAKEAADDKVAFVFMGHGTSHEANATYTAMQAKMDELGFDNCFVGTVEGLPPETALPEVKKAVEAKGYQKVILRPMMVVAGDHANNDMAANEEGSWYYAFVNGGKFEVEGQDKPVDIGAGFGAENVECQINGLGEIKAVQKLYIRHTTDVMERNPNALVQKSIRELNELILKYATDKDVIAAYDTALKYFDEYRPLVDEVVNALRKGDTDKLEEYLEMLDEYIMLANKYAVEFQERPEVKEAIEKTIQKAEELRDLLKKYGIEKPEDVCDKIDEIKAEIEKAQADFEAALEEFINVTAKELLEEAAKELEKQAKEWAKDAGFTEEDIEQFMEMAQALQALLEEYKGLTPDEALDKAIADVKKVIEDNADLLTELAMEQLEALQEKWDNGDFDEYLEQAGLDRAQVEYIVKEIMAYVQGVSEGNTYQELQKQLEEAGKELEEKAAEIAELQDTVAALEQAKKEAEDKLAETEKALQEEKEKTAASEEQIKKLEEQAAKDAADLSKYENALKVMKAKPKMKSVKNKKGKKALVKFKGLKKLEATKYQVSYKAGKTKKKVLKKKTTSAKNLKLTLKKLKKGKKYTVKVRAAYTFKYQGKKYTVYSKWSKAKKVKIKK